MKFLLTKLSGVFVIEPDIYRDDRGFFLESYQETRYRENGIPLRFVQDNHSKSVKGTLRGLHAQLRKPQGKLVRVVSGALMDIIVDIRRGSPTYREWIGVELTAENFKQCYVPPGFAHGFYTLSDTAEMEYKCTDLYDPGGELHLVWNDPDIGVVWPGEPVVLSAKDRDGVRLRDVESQLPTYSVS